MKQLPYKPKFKRGDIIKYRANNYRITNIAHWGNNWGYEVELLTPVVDYSDHVLSIGSAGEQDMRLVSSSDIVLSRFEEKLFEIVTHYVKTGETVTPLSIKQFARELRSFQ